MKRSLMLSALACGLLVSQMPVQAENQPMMNQMTQPQGQQGQMMNQMGQPMNQMNPNDDYSEPMGLRPVGNPIERVTEAQLMQGYPDGKFHPEGPLTRAELAVIVDKAFKLNERQASMAAPEMKDVPSGHWAYNAIQDVLTRGVMKGYRPGYFHPDQEVTRAEALAIFSQAYGVYQYDQKTIDQIMSRYPDANMVPGWAEKAMATALKHGFVNTDAQANRIRPNQKMTRGDMAFTLNQYLERLHPSEANTQKARYIAPKG